MRNVHVEIHIEAFFRCRRDEDFVCRGHQTCRSVGKNGPPCLLLTYRRPLIWRADQYRCDSNNDTIDRYISYAHEG
jgi:hypothetical protein